MYNEITSDLYVSYNTRTSCKTFLLVVQLVGHLTVKSQFSALHHNQNTSTFLSGNISVVNHFNFCLPKTLKKLYEKNILNYNVYIF